MIVVVHPIHVRPIIGFPITSQHKNPKPLIHSCPVTAICPTLVTSLLVNLEAGGVPSAKGSEPEGEAHLARLAGGDRRRDHLHPVRPGETVLELDMKTKVLVTCSQC